MMQCNNLIADMNYLFDCDFFADDFDPEGDEGHQEFAAKVLEFYPWKDIYAQFYSHLTTECTTEKKVFNAINLFFVYCFDENPVPNPYQLGGYILYRIDLDKHWDEYGDFVDSFIIDILEKAGEISLTKDPYYKSWKDPKIAAEVERFRNSEAKAEP